VKEWMGLPKNRNPELALYQEYRLEKKTIGRMVDKVSIHLRERSDTSTSTSRALN